MDSKKSLSLLRKNLEENLQDWMPDNDNLVNKELALFDGLITRRDFLKGTSLAALSTLISGCGNSGAPSQWDGLINHYDGPIAVDIEDMASVITPANIVVDSDVLTSAVTHNPLGAFGSDDVPHVKDNAVIESFNPHIMTSDAYDFSTQSGFIQPDRTYGIPEYVHLSRDSDVSDYYLDIYEQTNSGHHGLKKTKVPLDGTASLTFNTLISANGSFHNRISGTMAYSQKMALLANIGPSIQYNDTTSIPLRLYYQTGSSALLEPGVEVSNSFSWKHIDLMKHFKSNETHLFSSYKIVEADTYHDGANQNFIYGTIRFDSLYNYGFIVTFSTISDDEPSVTFFAPEFLSYKADTIQSLVDGFESVVPYTHDSLKSFAIFAKNTFRPLAQMVDAEGVTVPQVIFSFVSFDIASGSTDGRVHPSGNFFDLSRFFELDKNFIKRYLLTVETSQGGVSYGLGGYKPTASITADADTFTLVFDTASIPSVDVWHDVYSQNSYQLADTFVRSLKHDGNSLNILMATSFYNQKDLGVSQKNLELNIDSAGILSNLTLQTADTFFDASMHEGQGYKELWFEEMKGHLNNYDTLADCVLHDNDILDFYCTHNHQGLLRSYYIVRYVNSDKSVNSFLIGFNEQGIVPQNDTDQSTFAYQDHDTLKDQIINNTALHYPPMPVAVNPRVMHPWHGVANDGEVLYTATRSHLIDQDKKVLITNDGSQGNLFSYAHATCDIVEKSWNMFEEQKQVDADKVAEHMVSIELHQLHLHVTNVYGMNAQLDDDTYVEVRFNKKLTVKDYSDVGSPKTYHVGPFSSLFLKPDASGKIPLEIDAGGNSDDKYNGAMMEYRFLSKQALSLQSDTPVANLVNTNGFTTEFKQCNISFRMYNRLSTDQFDKVRPGAPKDIGTAKDKLSASVKSEYQDVVPKFAEGYGHLHAGTAPNNASPTLSIRRSHEVVSLADGTTILVSQLNMKLGSWFSHVVFKAINWVRHAVKTIVQVVKHIVTEAEKALQKAAEAIKQAVIKLTKDIDAVIEAIATTIVNAAQDIAAAVEKAWDAVTTFAQEFWDFIKALFDMNNVWIIGQELKQIHYDQLKPLNNPESKNTQPHNTYTFLQDAETAIGHEIDNIAEKTKEGIDDTIDSIFGNSDDFDSHNKQGRESYSSSKDNSTSTDYILDQLHRIMASLPISGLLGCDLDPSKSTALKLLLETGEQIGEDTFDNLKDTAETYQDMITLLANGSSISSLEADLGHAFKNAADVVIDDMDVLLKGLVSLPTAILDDETLKSCLTGFLGTIERPLLDLVGLLLFLDENKFKSLEDLAYFIFGFGTNIIELVLGEALKPLEAHNIDIIEHISSGTYRSSINEMGGYMTFSSAQTNLASGNDDMKLEWYITFLVADSLNALAQLTQSIVTAYGFFSPVNKFFDNLSAWLNLIVVGCRIPSLARHTYQVVHTEYLLIISIFSDLSYMGFYLSNFVANIATGEKGTIPTYDPNGVVIISVILATLLRFIFAVLSITYYVLNLVFQKDPIDISLAILDGIMVTITAIRGFITRPVLNAGGYIINVNWPPKSKEALIAVGIYKVGESVDILLNTAGNITAVAEDIYEIIEVALKETRS